MADDAARAVQADDRPSRGRSGGRTDVRRREEILLATLSVLAERGYRAASTREIAARARASKETLYAWFGDKRGLFEALIAWQAEQLGATLAPALAGSHEPRLVLRAFAVALQLLLLGDRAVVINRAAISEAPADSTFAGILATRGRGSVVPALARYLEDQRSRGRLAFDDAESAIEVLIGLTIGDRQVRRLLGVLAAPEPAAIEARADRAVEQFLILFRARSVASDASPPSRA